MHLCKFNFSPGISWWVEGIIDTQTGGHKLEKLKKKPQKPTNKQAPNYLLFPKETLRNNKPLE